ncbi:hypothetical protein P7K49_021127 [Saguinus oedipus]|uniref:Uncharacterized protein n=1 Tax=Saguinus oedipus TaxID=9490 RepID=A0ABQ9URS4_SAGOE|nr:hypothetical protein P7K49_021127 [Saguinus oedipus]
MLRCSRAQALTGGAGWLGPSDLARLPSAASQSPFTVSIKEAPNLKPFLASPSVPLVPPPPVCSHDLRALWLWGLEEDLFSGQALKMAFEIEEDREDLWAQRPLGCEMLRPEDPFPRLGVCSRLVMHLSSICIATLNGSASWVPEVHSARWRTIFISHNAPQFAQ